MIPSWKHKPSKTKSTSALKGVKLVIESVDYALAKEMLGKLHNDQRNLSPAHVRRLMKALLAGEWDQELGGLDPLAFDKKAKLVNGQHRLTMLVQAYEDHAWDGTVDFLVAYNVPREILFVKDIGKSRSTFDVAKTTGQGLEKDELTIARRMFIGTGHRRATRGVTDRTIIEYTKKHLEAIRKVSKWLGKFKRDRNKVAAAFARALEWGGPKSRLKYAANVLAEGVVDKGKKADAILVSLRDRIILGNNGGGAGRSKWDSYGATGWVLSKWLGGEVVKRVNVAKVESFPLEDDLKIEGPWYEVEADYNQLSEAFSEE